MFQKLFKIICALFSRSEPTPKFTSGNGERISRFLTHRNQYSTEKRVVRHSAFFPPPDLRLSAYWTTVISEDYVWRLGRRFVAPSRGPIHGRADVNSLVICNDAALAIERATNPHFRHVEVCGWDTDKARARLQAIKLANSAELVLV